MHLRRIRRGDLSDLFEWRNNPAIYKWCRQYGPLHWLAHEAWYVNQTTDPKLEMFAVLNERLDLIGCCGLTDVDLVNRRAEFSLYIGPEYQHRGYAKKALIQLFDWGFNSLGLNRVWGESFDENPAMRLFEKIGMEAEGIRKEHYNFDGRFIHAHLYSIGAESFNRLHRPDK